MNVKRKQKPKTIIGIILLGDPQDFSDRPSEFPPETAPLEYSWGSCYSTLVWLVEPVLINTWWDSSNLALDIKRLDI